MICIQISGEETEYSDFRIIQEDIGRLSLMKKTIIALMLAVCMLCPVIGSAEAAPAEKAVPFSPASAVSGISMIRVMYSLIPI